MKSKWKVTSQTIDGERVYAVYRNRDKYGVDHSGNREYGSEYMRNKEVAQLIADELNSKGING